MKPVSFEELEKMTVVPVLMQKALLDFPPAIAGVALADDPELRRMSMEQGEAAEPQVLSAEQMLAGFEAEQTSFLIFFLASLPVTQKLRSNGKTNREETRASMRPVLIGVPHATIMSISPVVLLRVAAPHPVALPFASNLHLNVAGLKKIRMSERTGVHCREYLVRDTCLL
jgi:hypothetical protein